MKILIATSRFRDFAGSEITALELAEELRANAWDVTIASFEMGGVLQAGAEASGIRVVQLTPNAVLDKVWDLVWVFHPVTYYMLFATLQIQGMTVIYSSWSHFEPLECPPVNLHPVDLFTTNSREHFLFFTKEYPALSAQAVVLPNSVPPVFFECQPRGALRAIPRIAIVSNHPPQEVLDAATYLRSEGGIVDLFGNDGVMKRVTPQLLLGYDAVVTIGKTVPYCLVLQIPVFCYDHFGGPGWITAENVDAAAEYNFSGRCSRTRLNALGIAKALGSAHYPDLKAREELRAYAYQSFDLRENIQRILDFAKNTASRRPLWSEVDRTSLANLTMANILSRHNQIFLRERLLTVELRKAWNEAISLNESLEAGLFDERVNAKSQIEYRDSLVSELEQRVTAVERNANEQIVYRDELLHELAQQLADVNANAKSQIVYRDSLVSELEQRLTAVERNANEQIAYRDALLRELTQQLGDVNANAESQIEYRDSLVSELEQRLTAIERNANEQITYRDALLSELAQQLDDVNANAKSQIEYRDSLVSELKQRLNVAQAILSSRLELLRHFFVI